MANILLIENDTILADLIRITLEQAGHTVISIQDGADAIVRYLQTLPELIVLDLFLPQTDMLDLIRRVKHHPHGKNTAIIVLSAFGFAEVVSQALAAGANDYLLKPINIDILLERIQNLLQTFNQPKQNKNDEQAKVNQKIVKAKFRRLY